jgi:LysM repeat protein
MRANEFLEDISRRGFLQGAGAAALGVGSAQAKPIPTETVFVGPGDTVYSIARNFGITPQDIIKVNPGMNNTTKLEVDQKIKVPSANPDPHTKVTKTSTNPHTTNKKIEPGQTSKPVSTNQVAASPHGTTNNALQEPGFLEKLQKVASALGVKTGVLSGIINHESHYKHHIPNPKSGAVGLIQFTHKTAKDLGTTTQQLSKMSATQQLDYVYQFYKSVGAKPGMDIGDLYMLTFIPTYAGVKNPNIILGKKGGGKLPGTDLSMHNVWKQNPVFSNGLEKPYFTVGDVKTRLAQFEQ